MNSARIAAAITAAMLGVCAADAAHAQSITVLPVSIQMLPGQRATSLNIINHGLVESAVQVRAFVWLQVDGRDELVASDDLVASPPLATIAPGAIQVVRLVLRKPVVGKEATYRILLDQIPPAAAPGSVRIALRLSIPVAAPPATRVAPSLAFHVETSGGQPYLVAVNSGTAHDTVSDIVLARSDGTKADMEANTSPYILAGATRRWTIGLGFLPASGSLSLTAKTIAREITETVPIVAGRP
jgi:fimbrial chaperone protein